jgi:DnaJ-class molecular chaperone
MKNGDTWRVCYPSDSFELPLDSINLTRRRRDFLSGALQLACRRGLLLLNDALSLFHRLGVDVRSISGKEFTVAYFVLAKRYHPDRNPQTHDLMANINAARTAILQSYRKTQDE